MNAIRTAPHTLLALATLASAAAAQPAPQEIFERSISAIKDIDTIAYTITVTGDGSMGPGIMPAGEAAVRAARLEAPLFGQTFKLHVEGRGTETPNNQEQESINTLYAGDITAWVDHKRKSIQERPVAQAQPANGTITSLLWIPELVNVNPYTRELNNAELTLVGKEDINGESCYLIEVDYAEPAATNNRKSRDVAAGATDAKYWIAESDFLPRRIIRINNAQNLINLEFKQDISRVAINAGDFTAADLVIIAPEGYQEIVKPMPGKPVVDAPARDKTQPTITVRETEPTPAPKIDNRSPAPDFELLTAAGDTVTLADGEGRVRVLYFWGTWCAPCRNVSPLISKLAEDTADKAVDVYGIAIREREEEAADAYMKEKGYQHTLLLPPGGPRDNKVASDYRVRFYPTVIVVTPDNKIAAVESLSKEVTPDVLAERIADAVNEALAASGT